MARLCVVKRGKANGVKRPRRKEQRAGGEKRGMEVGGSQRKRTKEMVVQEKKKCETVCDLESLEMLFLFLLCRFFFLWPLISVFASTFRDAVQPLFPSAHPVQIITWKNIEYSTTSESNAVVVLAEKYNTVEMKRLLNKFETLKAPKKSLKILDKKINNNNNLLSSVK